MSDAREKEQTIAELERDARPCEECGEVECSDECRCENCRETLADQQEAIQNDRD
tara:strand:+ start:887 stop:1051 length:165 start_codon:yes stop_codon:yes gene_type:complete